MIVFVEVPSFYAEAERLRDEALRGWPVVVGGDPRKRGLVQSASREALAAGCLPGMTMQEALARCPDARAVKTDMPHYRELSGRLRGCFRSEAEAVEPAGLESGYIEIRPGGEDPERVAVRLIARVGESLGLPLRAGIASAKFLARLAAEEALPGRCVRIEPGRESAFLAPLPVARLPGVGPKTEQTLARLGAHTIGDLMRLERDALERALGNHGLRIRELAQGELDSSVRANRHPHSLSREQTFHPPEVDVGELWECLQRLSQLLGEGLHEQGLCARRVGIKLRFDDQQTTTRSRTLAVPVSTAAEIFPVTVSLLDRTEAGPRGVGLLGVSVAGLGPRPKDRQLELFA